MSMKLLGQPNRYLGMYLKSKFEYGKMEGRLLEQIIYSC